jgi:hypothetical protein
VAVGPTDGDRDVITHDLTAHHRQCLALGGVDLARHDGRSATNSRMRIQIDIYDEHILNTNACTPHTAHTQAHFQAD